MMTDFNSKRREKNRSGEDGEFSANGFLWGLPGKFFVEEGEALKSGQQKDQTLLYPTPHCTESCSPARFWQTVGRVAFTLPACGLWFSFSPCYVHGRSQASRSFCEAEHSLMPLF